MTTENQEETKTNGVDAGQAEEYVTKRVTVKKSTIAKMMGIRSLFNDELPDEAKDSEVIAFFLEKSFPCFLQSGETARRLQKLIE